jgi:XTP/dITP diphosphohydrolase
MAALTKKNEAPGALQVVFASGNPGKLREYQSLLGDCVSLTPQLQFAIDSAEESGSTFTENALLKARHASRLTGLPAIADDSGLEVDFLNGLPGVRSARYAGEGASDAENNARLLEELAEVEEARRTARFRCVAVFVRSADDPEPLIAKGVWEGRISTTPIGIEGFGYDPVFFDVEAGVTAAQLSSVEKNRRSHRGAAARKLRDLIATLIADRTGR